MHSKYYLSAIAAYLIWGAFALPLKALSEYPSGQILYWRVCFALLILALLIITIRRSALGRLQQSLSHSTPAKRLQFWGLSVLSGMLLASNWWLFIYVVNYVSVQTGAFAYLICPILTAALGALLLKEPLTPPKYIALLLSAGSCMVLGSTSPATLGYSITIALLYALYLVIQKGLQGYDKLVLLGIQLGLAFALIAPFYAQFGAGDTEMSLYFVLMVMLISAVFTVLPLWLSLYALKDLSSGTIGILMYLNPLLNFAVAFVIFRESITLAQACAYTLICVSVVVYNLPQPQKKALAA